ncbi:MULTISPECIES: cytochrome c oxidase subunit I [unclassified Rhodanobacter]|uniref:cytochrome c oxidase subunit I n=1 Tax=unclassified Rhodanobacter TaxID=2621553 RepID=UPI001BDE62F2|nr:MULTISPECIES: cytochrome c oxidase subunit I [unclassified Rhodanobacter]MBT2144365.1 cytochrome c oxidase subunit I [Rhodanobacter sp. LX-99]MBT2149968.1 cytochrome c oxidase subunit I [Rhodanobacter sp. LX-100]
MSYAATHDQHDDHHGAPKGFFQRWCMSTNHKDIGTLYLIFSLTMLFIGGSFAMLIRAELFKPGMQLMQPYFFNEMTAMHALVMIFGAIMPAFVGLGNWMIPLMVGAPDMALPRMNNLSFWILPFAFLLLLSTLFLPGGAPAGGWTMYPPLSLQSSSLAYAVFAIHLMGISSIMGAINIIATILNMRAPGMDLMKMPVFVWSWLITAFLLIAVMPALAGAVTMLLTDKYFGTNFFNPGGGGDPVLYQHIFWFFGHPEVYIMILPAFGIISEIVPTFARKPIFGYKAMVFAIACIAFLSFIVWAHHMFAVGLPLGAEVFFMYATMLISVPTGVKVFNWVATMWGGSMTFETPMLFAIAFIILFTIGGFSGLMMALVPADFQYHDTYFIVAHFHYVLVTGALFAIIGASYYWMPKWTGNMYSEFWGKVHFWNSVIWVNVLFFPQHFLGLAGMPRRIPDYNVAFANFNMISSIGGFLFGATQLIFVGVLIHCAFFSKKKATDRVWEGAKGLEWTIPSPAPHHTFEVPPVINDDELAHGHVND